MCLCMHVCMSVYACMYAYMHVCMYACMYVCMYVCMHVSILEASKQMSKTRNKQESRVKRFEPMDAAQSKTNREPERKRMVVVWVSSWQVEFYLDEPKNTTTTPSEPLTPAHVALIDVGPHLHPDAPQSPWLPPSSDCDIPMGARPFEDAKHVTPMWIDRASSLPVCIITYTYIVHAYTRSSSMMELLGCTTKQDHIAPVRQLEGLHLGCLCHRLHSCRNLPIQPSHNVKGPVTMKCIWFLYMYTHMCVWIYVHTHARTILCF